MFVTANIITVHTPVTVAFLCDDFKKSIKCILKGNNFLNKNEKYSLDNKQIKHLEQ